MTHFTPGDESAVIRIDDRRSGAGESEARRLRRLVSMHGSPLLLVDGAHLRRRFRQLGTALPGVGLYYAVKAFPNSAVLRMLAEEGAGFDVASCAEIDRVRASGIDTDRVIHTHPVKKIAEISAALLAGVTTFVVDNADELVKFRPFRDRVSLLLRLRFQSPDAVVDLSRKFGCDPREAPALLARASREGIRIGGVSFHVGSQCRDPRGHVAAVKGALDLVDTARAAGLASLDTLDIGGGFPADYGAAAVDIEAFCAPIRAALSRAPRDMRVIAEPGRYLVADAVTSVASVIGRAVRDGRPWYYIDDGVYGSYSGRLFDHATYPVDVFRTGSRRSSVLAGPTCDSIDVIADDIDLPSLRIGDLVIGRSMGAYTAASATDFNGMPRAAVVVTRDRADEAAAEPPFVMTATGSR